MKKFSAVLALLASTLVVPALAAAPASARCAPPGNEVIYVFTNKSFTYYPTNVHSDWAIFRKGGSITYSQTKTMQVSASVTATVSAEAGVIFAKASTSLGVTVGGSKSWTQAVELHRQRPGRHRSTSTGCTPTTTPRTSR